MSGLSEPVTPPHRRGRLYRLARAIVSPLLPGRGPSAALRRPAPGERVLNVGSGPLVYGGCGGGGGGGGSGGGGRGGGGSVINVDRRAHPGVRVLGDAAALPFADGSVDGVICEVTLEHVADPAAALAEIRRVLRPGGRAYLSVPFLQPMHSAPEDFVRWTTHGLRRLVDASGMRVVEAGVAGGPTSTLTWVLAEWVGVVLSFGSASVQSAVAVALRVVFAPLKLLDLALVRLPGAAGVASLLYVVVGRPEGAGGTPGTPGTPGT